MTYKTVSASGRRLGKESDRVDSAIPARGKGNRRRMQTRKQATAFFIWNLSLIM
jgi:hypothetical protein